MRQFLLFLTLAFLVQTPDHITARRKGSKLCKYIEITSKAGIISKYPSYLGVFERQDSKTGIPVKVNGKLMYRKSNDKALWWSTSADSWKIGNKKYEGSNIGNVYNAKDICKGGVVDLLHDKCGSWWKYYNDDHEDDENEWSYDTTIKVKCFDLYFKMENDKYCAFPEDEDGIQMFYQDVKRYDDLGEVSRACTADNYHHSNCTHFYFSKIEKAYFICPPGSEFREMKGYRVFYNATVED